MSEWYSGLKKLTFHCHDTGHYQQMHHVSFVCKPIHIIKYHCCSLPKYVISAMLTLSPGGLFLLLEACFFPFDLMSWSKNFKSATASSVCWCLSSIAFNHICMFSSVLLIDCNSMLFIISPAGYPNVDKGSECNLFGDGVWNWLLLLDEPL